MVCVYIFPFHALVINPTGNSRFLVRAFAHGAMCRRIDPSWEGARCSSVVRAFAHGAMCRRIDPSWDGPIELFLVPSSVPQFV